MTRRRNARAQRRHERARSLLAVAALVALASTPVRSQSSDAPFHYGVGTHFAFDLGRGYRPATQMPHLTELGVDSFRDDVNAEHVVAPSPLAPVGTGLDRLNEVIRARAWTPVLILRGPVYGTGSDKRYVPLDDTEIDAFARYAGSLVATTRPYRPLYEIWNEWNLEWRRPPLLGGLLGWNEDARFSPERYVAVAKPVYEAIKAADPSATVLTGSIGDDPDWVFTRRAIAAGLFETGDGISVHLYNHCQRGAERNAERLIEMAESFHAVLREGGGRVPPVYVTEFGWPNQSGRCFVPPDLSAANVAQFTLWARSTNWIRGVWVYELRNSGNDGREPEHNFGLYGHDDTAKPAACAYREAIELSRTMRNPSFRSAPDGIRWMTGQGPDGHARSVVWATRRDGTALVRPPEGGPALAARTLCGSDVVMGRDGSTFGMMPLVITSPDEQVPDLRLELQGGTSDRPFAAGRL